MTTKTETKAIAKKDESSVEFMPLGAADKIRLTASMVRQFIAVPTKSGALPSERDCIRFIMLCRGKRANPFEGDCFLIGYDTQKGPSFSLVCGVELFLKRAAVEADYDGAEYGIIVQTADGGLMERQGSFMAEGEKLLGGWAKVYRKNHTHPVYKTVKLATYHTGRSRWEADPAGMIAKVPLSQALREAFPVPLGGLYSQEEMERVTETGQGLMASAKEPVSMPKELPEAQMPEPHEQEQSEPTDQPDAGGPTDSEGRPLEEKPPASDNPVAVVSFGAVLTKPTKKGGTRWSAQGDDGEWYNTFDKDDAAVMQEASETPKKVSVEYVDTKFGRDIVSIAVAK